MRRGEYSYIWQAEDWPAWRYDLPVLAEQLADVCREQGILLGRLADMGLRLRENATLENLTEDVIRTSEIEGEKLDLASVRSSLARHLGVDIGALAPIDRNVEGMVEMVLDATTRCREPLTQERLFGWHAGLFPDGQSGRTQVLAGGWRDDAQGPMQVVSGPLHRQKVHFQAPPAEVLQVEMDRFLDWANRFSGEPAILKAGIAHLWLVTLHPFEDGNGRIARAVGDLFLTRADGCTQRYYSLSAQIQRDRKDYYEILEHTQKGTLDITDWLSWFLATLRRAISSAQVRLDGVLFRAHFWQRWAGTPFNPRQARALNRLLEGFEGQLTTGKWATLTRCSSDTALRDISELVALGVLRKKSAGGRSTAYELAE